jgi:hypothetical protein
MVWLERLSAQVAHADPVAIALVILVLGGGAAVSLAFGWRHLHRARLMTDTPTARARSAPQGYVELEGVARAFDDQPIIAKLTGLPCCWYRYRIEEQTETHDERNRVRSRWKVVDQGESDDTFWLDDGTGRVAVDPAGAEIETRYRDSWGSRRMTGINYAGFVRDFVASHPSNTTYRFTEWRINRGDPIYVIGLLKNLGSHLNGPTLDERALQVLREWKRDQPALHARFDLNADGRIDEREWWLARRAARREAERLHQESLAQVVEGVNLVSATRDPNRPFIISAYPQHEVLRRYYWRALGYGLAFFASGGAATWVLATRFA